MFPFISPSHSFSPHTNIPLSHLFPSVAQPFASLFDFPTFDGTSGTLASASQDPISDNLSTHDVPSDLISPLDIFILRILQIYLLIFLQVIFPLNLTNLSYLPSFQPIPLSLHLQVLFPLN